MNAFSKYCEMAVKERTRKLYLDRVREYVEWYELHNYRSNDPDTITGFNDPETASFELVNIMIVTLRTDFTRTDVIDFRFEREKQNGTTTVTNIVITDPICIDMLKLYVACLPPDKRKGRFLRRLKRRN